MTAGSLVAQTLMAPFLAQSSTTLSVALFSSLPTRERINLPTLAGTQPGRNSTDGRLSLCCMVRNTLRFLTFHYWRKYWVLTECSHQRPNCCWGPLVERERSTFCPNI